MLKKRNIAMAMAVATVATTVAPAFAAVTAEDVNEATLVSKVTELLNTRYSDAKETGEGRETSDVDAYKNSVYKIFAGSTQIESVKHLKELIEKAKVNETTLELDVVDKGHKTVNGKIVATEDNKYSKYTNGGASTALDGIKALTTIYDTHNEAAISATTGGTVYEITLKSGAELQLTDDSYALDLTVGLDKDGNEIDLTNPANLTTTVGKNVVGFKINETEATAREIDLPETYVSTMVLPANTVTDELKLSDYITEFGYNKKGVQLSEVLETATQTNGVKVTKNGKEYRLHGLAKDDVHFTKVKYADGRYEFTISLQVSQSVGTAGAETTSALKLVMTSATQPELEAMRTGLMASSALTLDTTYTTLAGDDRFDTAIEVSKATYGTESTNVVANADSVVLVGESAIVDGLAAAPLAKEKNAPILLSKKDSLTTDTIKEIKRVFSNADLNNTNTKTVYIVGGENVISTAVEKQLLTEMNVKIVRLAGADRVETSLKIAKELNNSAATGAYIVGADGEADAMSIASIAAMENAPIIVTNAKEVGKDTLNRLALEGINKVTVVGGEAKISTDVMKQLKVEGITATRIAGDTRQETNAKVIDAKKASFDQGNVFVAKDGYVGGNDKLIDALTVAQLAAHKSAPIVLTTEELTIEQADAVKAIGASGNELVKAGNGISSKVIKSIVKIMGLN